jgi:uncharacterized membrane protein
MATERDPPSDDPGRARRAGQSAYEVAVDIVLTGVVVILPLVISLYVLQAAYGFIASALRPFIQLLQWAGLIEGVRNAAPVQFLITLEIVPNATELVTDAIALAILVVLVVAVGTVTRNQYGERLIDYFDAIITALPGIGSVYQSFRRLGDVMLDSGMENFQEVKLVEFPYEETYVLGFETNRSPVTIRTAAQKADEEMLTMFLPLAPNPVMGGFLTHIPEDRVQPVDMTVEEAVQSIITSGIATPDPENGEFQELTDEQRRRISGMGGDDTDRDTEPADD